MNEYLKIVEEYFNVSFVLIGMNINQVKSRCCKDTLLYILHTDWALSKSTVVCVDCRKAATLYKLWCYMGLVEII